MTNPKTTERCPDCMHSLENNLHGFDQDDFVWLDEKQTYVYGGSCKYCKECSELIKRQSQATQPAPNPKTTECNICPRCGLPNDVTATVCSNCGKDLEDDKTTPPSTPAPQAQEGQVDLETLNKANEQFTREWEAQNYWNAYPNWLAAELFKARARVEQERNELCSLVARLSSRLGHDRMGITGGTCSKFCIACEAERLLARR